MNGRPRPGVLRAAHLPPAAGEDLSRGRRAQPARTAGPGAGFTLPAHAAGPGAGFTLPAHAAGPVAGFTLPEVLMAAVVLLVATVAGSGVVGLATSVNARDRTALAESDAVLRLTWRLEQLPYVLATPGEDSVVEALFPHATTALNRTHAFFLPSAQGPWPEASFVTVHTVDGQRLISVARFVRRDVGGGWSIVRPGEPDGLGSGAITPAPGLRVEFRSAARPQDRPLATRLFLAGWPSPGGAP